MTHEIKLLAAAPPRPVQTLIEAARKLSGQSSGAVTLRLADLSLEMGVTDSTTRRRVTQASKAACGVARYDSDSVTLSMPAPAVWISEGALRRLLSGIAEIVFALRAADNHDAYVYGSTKRGVDVEVGDRRVDVKLLRRTRRSEAESENGWADGVTLTRAGGERFDDDIEIVGALADDPGVVEIVGNEIVYRVDLGELFTTTLVREQLDRALDGDGTGRVRHLPPTVLGDDWLARVPTRPRRDPV
ncbi:hypothetical protein [Gordonia sp. NPDC003429]